MSKVILDIPDRLLPLLAEKDEDAGMEMRLSAAMKLFELGRLSSGAAAELAGIPRVAFLSKLCEYGVNAFQYSTEELRRDVENARRR